MQRHPNFTRVLVTTVRRLAIPMLLVSGLSLSAESAEHSAAGPKSGTNPVAGKAPAQHLGLAECIQAALEANPGLRAYELDEQAARERVRQAEGERYPSLSGVADWTHWNARQPLTHPNKPGAPNAYDQDIASLDLVASMPLFTGGRITHGIEAARLGAEAAAHETLRARRALTFQVCSVFFDILGQRRVIEAVDASIKAIREHKKKVQDLLDVQKAARVDMLRTEVRLAALEQTRVAEQNRLLVLYRRLENLMGGGLHKDETAARVRGRLAAPREEIPDVESSFREALSQRADYLAALAQVGSLREQVAVAEAVRLPQVSLVGSYGRHWAPGADIEQSGADDSEDIGYIGVHLAVPLFAGGRIVSNIREQRYRLAAARRRLRQLELDIRLDVQTAVLAMQSALQRVRATEKAVAQAEESLRIERQKYEVGKGSITDVLDAQSAFLEARTNYYRALAGYHTARSAWRLAVGMKAADAAREAAATH